MLRTLIALLGAALPAGAANPVAAAMAVAAPIPARIEFNRDIRPILSENCFACHATAKQKGGLRLDSLEKATNKLDDGAAIVPGNAATSLLMTRILASSADEIMPPPETHKQLTAGQIDLLRRWIDAGAPYQKHWAFIPPVRPAIPAVANSAWVKQPIDHFVAALHAEAGVAPTREAAPEAWLRRVNFDLTGLPPTPEEHAVFVADLAKRGEATYAQVVDRLLASPHYGERMASDWMDIARYADTHGFNNDTERSMWRWRDWVIDSFNNNMPYDRFVTEQLAGDLLPAATMEQKIATGFGRNHVINSEGGIIDEEYRVEYVADRVRTLGMAWMGLTMECARCHDHKFDPFAQKDYYRMFAFFNNVPEWGEDGRVANAPPMIAAPTRAQQQQDADITADLAGQTRLLDAIVADRERQQPAPGWLGRLRALVATTTDGVAKVLPEGTVYELEAMASKAHAAPAHPVFGTRAHFDGKAGMPFGKNQPDLWISDAWSFSIWVNWQGGDAPLLSTMDYRTDKTSQQHGLGSEVRITATGELELRLSKRWPMYALQARATDAMAPNQWHHLVVTYDGGTHAAGVRFFIDGQETQTRALYDGLHPTSKNSTGKRSRIGVPALLGASTATGDKIFAGEIADLRTFGRALGAEEVSDWTRNGLRRWLATPAANDEARQRATQVRELVLRAADTEYRWAAAGWDRLHAQRVLLQRNYPTVMVMAELPTPRPAHVLVRGLYDAPGDAVEPGVPESLLLPWPKDAPKNRLGLARWLTQPDHPLTARVVVNRIWAQMFGVGFVKTVEDLGAQGEYPSHPELFDWLVRSFVDGGWNIKALLRGIALSATYRQQSATPASDPTALALRERDPENRLLARGPRTRLTAEMIRDHLLASSGLLRHRTGGPSVFPYQPERLYEGIIVQGDYPGEKWITSSGDDLYRRSLYTFWKRTVLHPVMGTFDAPDREVCTARRSATNTPLQALTLMNEPGAVEAARHLALRMLAEGGSTDAERLAYGFRLATGRQPSADEVKQLSRTLDWFRVSFRTDAKGAAAFVKVGTSVAHANVSERELAATAALAGLIFNLDESVTKG